MYHVLHHTSVRLAASIQDFEAGFLVSDFNLASPMIAAALRNHGIDCVSPEHHVELATAVVKRHRLSHIEDGNSNAHMLFDAVGIWGLGPMGNYGCDASSLWPHILSALLHPFPHKKGVNARGNDIRKMARPLAASSVHIGR